MSSERLTARAGQHGPSEIWPWLKCARAWGFVIALALTPSRGGASPDSRLGDFAITQWTRESGLPDNSVTCLTQTHDGFLWLGTASGLARFDGLKFTLVDLPRRGSRLEKEITALYQDSRERLWVGTRSGGLWCLEAGSVHQINLGRGFDSCAITCIAGGTNGELWV